MTPPEPAGGRFGDRLPETLAMLVPTIAILAPVMLLLWRRLFRNFFFWVGNNANDKK